MRCRVGVRVGLRPRHLGLELPGTWGVGGEQLEVGMVGGRLRGQPGGGARWEGSSGLVRQLSSPRTEQWGSASSLHRVRGPPLPPAPSECSAGWIEHSL